MESNITLSSAAPSDLLQIMPPEVRMIIYNAAAAAESPRIVELTLKSGDITLRQWLAIKKRAKITTEQAFQSLLPRFTFHRYEDVADQDDPDAVEDEIRMDEDTSMNNDDDDQSNTAPITGELVDLEPYHYMRFQEFKKTPSAILPIVNSKTIVPSLLKLCLESRLQASKHTELAFNTFTDAKYTYFNFAVDTVFIDSEEFVTSEKYFASWRRNIMTVFLNLSEGTNRIKRLAIGMPRRPNNERLQMETWIASILAIFSGLEKLDLVLAGFSDGYDSARELIAPIDFERTVLAMKKFCRIHAAGYKNIPTLVESEKLFAELEVPLVESRANRGEFCENLLRWKMGKYTPQEEEVKIPEISTSVIVDKKELGEMRRLQAECGGIMERRRRQESGDDTEMVDAWADDIEMVDA